MSAPLPMEGFAPPSRSAYGLPVTLRISGGRAIQLDDVLGEGTLGTVFAGRTEGSRFSRGVAVKFFDRLSAGDRAHVGPGLARTLAACACVCDPRIVQIYDFDLSRQHPFVVTELVDGGALEALMAGFARQGVPFPPDLAVLIGLKIAEGLAAAQESLLPDGSRAGVTHGNVNANEVFVTWTGEVKVSDFGLAAAFGGSSRPRPVATLRQLVPMSPEVACGGVADARSDVFSLGIVMWQMLLGQRFSPHTSPTELFHLVRSGRVHASLAEQALLPPLRDVLRRATQADPRRRFAGAHELATALHATAALMGIPDVPAFIACGVEDAFMRRAPRSGVRGRASHEAGDAPRSRH